MNLEETVRILHELAMQTPQGRAAFTQRKTSVPPEPQPHLGGGETVEETAEKFLRQQIEPQLVTQARIASLAALLQGTHSPCTLENCGHMRQLDAIVDFLKMPRGGISVLGWLRTRQPHRADLTRFVTAYESMRRRFRNGQYSFEECDRLVELFLANKLLSEESP